MNWQDIVKEIGTDKTKLSKMFHQGDLGFIEAYANTSLENLQYSITKGFEYCIYSGNLEAVSFLLTSDKIAQNADVHHNNSYALTISCHLGHSHLVEYLLSSDELKQHSDIHANEDTPLRYAAESNELEIINYLLQLAPDTDINHHSSITGTNAFMCACDQNSIEAAKYFAGRADFDIEKSLYTKNKDDMDGFMLACENHEKDTDLVDFIVFELGFKPRDSHLQYFVDFPDNKEIMYAQKIIGIRDLEKKLSSELDNKNKEKKLKL